MNEERETRTVAGLELKWREFPPPSGTTGEGFGIWVLADPDALLDQITEAEYYAHDERMPYFGAVWPAAESLVERILSGPRLVDTGSGGEPPFEVLDLGCGLGACGFAAAHRGAHVTFMDWEPRALEIVEASALQQTLPLSRFEFVSADWRKPSQLRPFDLILGADVLYEDRNAPGVAAFLAAQLKPGAQAWISDPNRPHARRFPQLAQEKGLEFLASEILPPMPHHIDVSLLRVRRPPEVRAIVDPGASG